MKLNGIALGGYSARANEVTFSLSDTTVQDAAALDGQTLVVTDDDGTTVTQFGGYYVAQVSTDGGSVRVRCVRKIDEGSEAAIEALETNLASLRGSVTAVTTIANDAKTASDEAREVAESAGTDPQLQALATMQVASMDLTGYSATQVVSFRDYWPEWAEGVSYQQNDCVRYDGRYWRVSQDTTSQGVYPPGTSESLYYEVELAEDGIIVYRECHGEYDEVKAGELRHYPDADGPVYRAKVDTAYDPDTVPGNWELVQSQDS